MEHTTKIAPMLWFDNAAEAAANHYIKAFADGHILHIAHYGKEGPRPEGSVMVAYISIGGQEFALLNAGPQVKPTDANSYVITCADQAEVDRMWDHFSEGGSTSMCGWLKDRWGFSWQITPKVMLDILTGDDEGAKGRAFAAMMQMTKFDVAAIERAARE